MINYKTIQGSGEASYEIQKSRFLAFVQNVTREEEAQAFILNKKKLHWEARHCCSAYVLGERGQLQKADDDGEPSGTAGKPILEVLKKQELSDIVIVIVRYFGGIKLGAGGLIRAYGKAASLGLASSQLVTKTLFRRLDLTIAYALLGALENYLHQQEIRIADKNYSDTVTLTLLVPETAAAAQQEALINLTAAQCRIEERELVYVDIAQ